MRIVVTADTAQIVQMAAALEPRRAMMGLSVAVNDTARQVRRYARSTIAKESSIRAARVERGLAIKPFSTPATLTATVTGSGSPLGTKEFRARQTRRGVSAMVWGRRQLYPGAFIVPSLGGNVFTNTGGENKRSGRNNAIEKHYGAGIAQVMAQEHVHSAIEAQGNTRLLINAQRQLDRYIAGAGGAGR